MPSRCPALARRLLPFLARHELLPDRYRPRLLRWMGRDVPDQSIIFSGLRVVGAGPLKIGVGTFVNHDCLLDVEGGIVIGRRVSLGNRVMLITSDHELDDPAQRGGPRRMSPIRIGDGAWIGAGAIVLAGTTIGAGAVVGAGSIVTRDCEPHGLYLGAPARLVRDLATGPRE